MKPLPTLFLEPSNRASLLLFVEKIRNSSRDASAETILDQFTLDNLHNFESVAKEEAKAVIIPAASPAEYMGIYEASDMAEKNVIQRVLSACNGNKIQASKILKIDRKTLYNKINKYGITFTQRPKKK